MRQLLAALTVTVLAAGVAPAPASAGDNRPPVAVDDPGIACQAGDRWGGSFPIVEDFRSSDPTATEWFAWFGECLPTANDWDPDGDALTVELVGDPPHGEATWVPGPPAMLAYRPDPDWSTEPGDQPGGDWLSDAIAYRVFDGTAYSNTASFRIWVAPINDPPSFAAGPDLVEGTAYGPPVNVPWATGISAGPVSEVGQAVSFEVVTDTRNAPLMFETPPSVDADGTLRFTPGTEPGLAYVTITARDDGGLEDWGVGRSTMDPPDDSSDPVTFSVVVWPPDPVPPDVVDDQATVDEDSSVVIDVTGNDTDRNGDPFLIMRFGDGAKGAVGPGNVPGTLVYTPAPDATGIDTFEYTVADAPGSEATATVTVTIVGHNDAPVAHPDTAGVDEGAGPTAIDVLANDSDVDGDTPGVASVGEAAHGSVTLDAGTVRYAPAAGFSGGDVFAYTIDDGHGATATASVSVTVAPDAGPPVLGALGRSLPLGASVRDTVRVRLTWSATDAGSGVATYELQRQREGGPWRTVELAGPLARAVTLPLAAGDAYAFRVRATDHRANASAWSSWRTFVPRHREERTTATSWSGTWRTGWDARLSGGRDRWTAGAGRRVAYTFTGRAIGWVGRRSTTGGSARVWIDGVPYGTITTHGTSTAWRAVVFSAVLPVPGSHRIVIRPVGDGRVDVDAFVVLP